MDDIRIQDFIDVHNKEHIEALLHLRNSRHWPEDFLPENIVFGSSFWLDDLYGAMANEWMDLKISE